MTKSEMAAQMALDVERFASRNTINRVATQSPEEIRQARADRYKNQYYQDSMRDAETGGTERDQHGRMRTTWSNV